MRDGKVMALVVAVGIVTSAFAQSPESPALPRFDTRLPEAKKLRGGFTLRSPTLAQRTAAAAFESEISGVRLRWDGVSGAPKWIVAPPGEKLSASTAGKPEDAARSFLRERSALLGIGPLDVDRLVVTDVVSASGGGAHVHFKQSPFGVDVFQSHVLVNLASEGAVRSLGARVFSDLRAVVDPSLRAVDAVRIAIDDVYPDRMLVPAVIEEGNGEDRLTRFDGTGFGYSPEARLVLFPEREGARLAWQVEVAEPTLYTSYLVLIDALDGSLLFRQNLTLYADATYLDAGSPEPHSEESEPAQYVTATIPSVTAESPNGWIDGAGTSLEGNNTTSHLGYWSNSGLAEPSALYDYPFNTPRSALVNAWWWTNEAHDRFYELGFDEAAGNFQQDNFGLGGVGGDAVKAVVYNAGIRSSAFFQVGADGLRALVNFGWFNCRFCADHDGLVDLPWSIMGERSSAYYRLVVFHEFVHGVTSRMVGGPSVVTCLQGVQSRAMGEGWSDVFARSLFEEPPEANYVYEGYGVARSQHHDLTYGDLCGVANNSCEEHADGMIWLGALWDLRQSMLALDPGSGLDDFHRLLVEALEWTPCNPTMLDGRAGILQADTNLFASAHHDLIWNAFAARGMGDGASSTGENDPTPVEDFTVTAAHACSAPALPSGLNATPEGDNAIRLNYTTVGASAIEVWREDLDNPFDRSRRIGFTDDPTTYLDDTVQGGKSYRYHVIALGAGGISCASPASATDDATATGACSHPPIFDPALAVVEDDGSCSVTLNWSAAAEGCPGSGDPIVYSVHRAPTPGFEPADKLLVGRTTGTSFQDVPPDVNEFPFYLDFGDTSYYLVLAQHGTPDDPPDHGLRRSSQILRWVPGLPTSSRSTVAFWDFESGPQGWVADNTNDPVGGWTLAQPSPTRYAGALLAPDEAAGGAGQAWVTGDAGGPSGATDFDCDGQVNLDSPTWDGTGGATLLSFDYWAQTRGTFQGDLRVIVRNGTDQVTVRKVGFNTTQTFETPGRYGWQRAELDLADYVVPTSTMSVRMQTRCDARDLVELGVDNVRVEAATACSRSGLALESVSVDDTPPGWGNGNGVLEPGETARLEVTVRNDGTATAFAPTGTVAGGARGLLVHETRDGFPDVPAAGSAVSLGDGFTVTLPVDLDCNESTAFDFEFVDAAGTVSHGTWHPELGTSITETVFEDDFETDKGWIVEGVPTLGIFERGDPVGTMNGGAQANPENDSPNDAGNQCYVTENSGSADPNAADVDVDPILGQWPRLGSPLIDLSPYKRARVTFDLWYYDNSSSNAAQDVAEQEALVDVPLARHPSTWQRQNSTNGWVTVTRGLADRVPMTSDVRFNFRVYDRGADHVVESGVDNVRFEGDRQQCDPLGVVNPPNGVGNTLLVDKNGGDLEIGWIASPVDGTHDAAAYYRLHVSGAPDGGFAVPDTATGLSSLRALAGPDEYYLVSAVNDAGTSGDEPAP